MVIDFCLTVSKLCSEYRFGSGAFYLVNGESDAPAGEEQRAPANGWCELETLSVNFFLGKYVGALC
jgi:hypothetical protein